MKLVNLDAVIAGLPGGLDPNPYLKELPRLAPDLPSGARAFATDPDHYAFGGKRCVKDLKFESFESTGSDLDLYLRHNCWKHDEDLVIHYEGVAAFTREDDPQGTSESDDPRAGALILDEILPHAEGCSHELAFHTGTLTVICRDLTATWVETDCPDLT